MKTKALESISDSAQKSNKASEQYLPTRNLKLIRNLGRTGIKPNTEIDNDPTVLPEGYRYEDSDKIEPIEVAKLIQQVEIGWDIEDDYIEYRAGELRSKGLEVFDVGVRATDGRLVGFGSVAYKGENGELCDFVVSPDHQSKGIGKAIIAKRLKMAEAAGLTSLCLPVLEPTNTLKSYYLENGFHETNNGAIVRGPHPIALSEITPQQLTMVS